MLDYLEVEDGFIKLVSAANETAEQEWLSLPNQVKIKLNAPGVLQVKSASPATQKLIISCGVHGNETAPIEIVSKQISQIVTGALTPKVDILYILGNPESMKISDRFVALNMNRLFCGAYKNYECNEQTRYEIERAALLEDCVAAFYHEDKQASRLHLDLHTAIKPSFHKTFAIRPFNQNAISNESKQLLLALGIEAVLQHNKPSTTFSALSVEHHHAEAYTLELGKVKPFGENNPEDFIDAISCLNQLVEAKPYTQKPSTDLVEYKVVKEIIKHSEAFKFYVPDDVENFTSYPQGYLIAEDEDYNYRVAYSQEAVVFPNINVPIGQRVAVMVTQVLKE